MLIAGVACVVYIDSSSMPLYNDTIYEMIDV
jgi:hypothetical protein